MGQDCLWDSEEQQSTLCFNERKYHPYMINIVKCFAAGGDCLIHQTSLIPKFVPSILFVAPRCRRCSLVPYLNEKQISSSFYSLCCSLLSQRQSCPIKKWGADPLCSLFSVFLLAVRESVSSHTKARSISSAGLSFRRELCLRDGGTKCCCCCCFFCSFSFSFFLRFFLLFFSLKHYLDFPFF